MTPGFLAGVPLWAILFGSMLAFLLGGEAGFRIGVRRRSAASESTVSDMGIALGGLLGLLGLLLAFTFGMAGARFDDRKSLVIEEANAIGTAWLRTDLIPEPMRSQARTALREYTQRRLEVARSGRPEDVKKGIARSEELQGSLWNAAVSAAAVAPTPATSLFVSSVNEVIDMHGRRIARAVRNPIPPIILVTLYGVSLLVVVAMGYSRGISGDKNPTATALIAIILALVLNLILDLDRPRGGYLQVSQEAMQDVRAMMGQ